VFARERKRSAAHGRQKILTVGVIALAALAAATLVVVDPNALCLLPILALALPLWLRRYPGERMLAALSYRDEGRKRRRASRARAPRSQILSVVRGGLLLACSLAVRPPPALPIAAAA
jgi:hypothetical protein